MPNRRSMLAAFAAVLLGCSAAGRVAPEVEEESWTTSADPAIVGAPDYLLQPHEVFVEIDASGVVQRVSGAYVLRATDRPGEGYRVLRGALLHPTFAEVHRAYHEPAFGAPARPINEAVVVPVSELIADGDLLPQQRAIIVRRSIRGVPAYQLFTLRFVTP